MGTKKSLLKFWQELIFIILLGVYLIGITMNFPVAFQQTVNILFYCLILVLIICLVSQFYFKNLALGIVLAVILGLASGYMILAVISEMAEMAASHENYNQMIFGLFFFMGLTAVAITMPFKYHSF